MAANAVIGFPRFTESFGFSGGSWEALYPAANLRLLPLSRVARSTDADPASTQLVATTTTARLVQLLAFVGHNASLEGSFRIRLYADTGLGVLLQDTGWQQFWPPVYAYGSLPFGDPSFFTLKYSDEERAGLTWTRAVWLDRGHVARAVKVEIDDPDNSDGFFQCGLFEIAQGWPVSANFGYGAEYGFRGRTQSAEALGGARWFERRDKPRIFRGQVQYLARDEALARAFEQQRRHDLDQPFLWLPHPDEPLHWLRNAFLARNTELGLMSYAAFGRDRVPLALEEVLG